ncbi:TetR/AcrR family transcriptional regulator C-terminal domain-containing protein [Nonomuraea sp. NPDC050786]|uniref:TetR/AcrR family transcriptional regulator C-terminal domain-containing protein n=1 Tax=Nonomuraea sp. NPDC050786 TaxID=3154840 RepID=UPI0033D7600E
MARQEPDIPGLPGGIEEAEPRLDRAQIAQAALDLLDEQGFDAFSMRKLAVALGIKSPSLYWHVRSKDELFDLLIDVVVGKCPLPDDDGRSWEERLVGLGLELRQVLLAHPAATRLLPGRVPFGPNGLRLADHIIGVLRQAGFDNRLSGYGYLLLLFYVVGFAGQEIAFGKGPENHARLGQITGFLRDLPADRYPHLTAVADELTARPGLTHRFELGLVGILGELDRRRRE